MDYLKQHVLASVPAIGVISRYLATRPLEEGEGGPRPRGEREGTLRTALQPSAMAPDEDRAAPDGVRGVLAASLAVGEDLGLLRAANSGPRVWALNGEVRDEVRRLPSTDSRAFRSLVLRCLNSRAVAAVEAGQSPPDVAIALTWLLTQDPLAPFPARWSDGPERAFDGAGLRAAVSNKEQWLAFMRWARSLGLATVTAIGRQKSYLIADPTLAVTAVLDRMPRRKSADQWFQHLRSLLPVLGDPRLVSTLPAGSDSGSQPPASIALAVQKLELAGRVRLVASADASNAVVLRVGNRDRRISSVHITEGAG
ncbi:MAG: hypothetical protein ACRDRV_22135 [Pseudonocardiaceae bacterium]